jgi:hypothetical protein
MKKQDEKSLSTKGHIKAFASAILPRLEAILNPLFVNNPHWNLAFQEAIGLYGYYMACKQEELNEFVEFVKSHPDEFRKDIVESKEFRDGFVIFFQDYLKMRAQKKKVVARRIFIEFAQYENKEEFELEKFDDALLKISVTSIEMLAFLKREIIPLKEKIIRDELKNKNLANSDKNEEWWFELDWEKESLSRFIQKWLYDNFNPNSLAVKQKYGVGDKWDLKLQSDVFDKEREEGKKIYSAIDELVQLGILKIRVASGGGFGGSSGAEYDFSKFGYQFLEYISA